MTTVAATVATSVAVSAAGVDVGLAVKIIAIVVTVTVVRRTVVASAAMYHGNAVVTVNRAVIAIVTADDAALIHGAAA